MSFIRNERSQVRSGCLVGPHELPLSTETCYVVLLNKYCQSGSKDLANEERICNTLQYLKKKEINDFSVIFRRFSVFSVVSIPTSVSVSVFQKTSVVGFGVG